MMKSCCKVEEMLCALGRCKVRNSPKIRFTTVCKNTEGAAAAVKGNASLFGTHCSNKQQTERQTPFGQRVCVCVCVISVRKETPHRARSTVRSVVCVGSMFLANAGVAQFRFAMCVCVRVFWAANRTRGLCLLLSVPGC